MILLLLFPIPYPGDLPDPEIELGSPALQVDSLPTKLFREAHLVVKSYPTLVSPWSLPVFQAPLSMGFSR